MCSTGLTGLFSATKIRRQFFHTKTVTIEIVKWNAVSLLGQSCRVAVDADYLLLSRCKVRSDWVIYPMPPFWPGWAGLIVYSSPNLSDSMIMTSISQPQWQHDHDIHLPTSATAWSWHPSPDLSDSMIMTSISRPQRQHDHDIHLPTSATAWSWHPSPDLSDS